MLRAIVVSVVVLMLIATGVSAKEGFRVKPVKSVPRSVASTDLLAPGDVCDVGITDAAYALSGWLYPPEEYAVYSDPADCDYCPGGWLPLQVSIMLQTDTACTLTLSAGVREPDLSVPTCPVPDVVACWSSTYYVVIPNDGLWVITLPLDLGCSVIDGPFFSCVRFEDDPHNAVLPMLVSDDDPVECVSYNDWGSGWDDLVYDHDFPGNLTIYTTLECQEAEHFVDIKPGSCPNPLNVKSRGVLPAAILGTADFDVTLVDPATIRLAGTVEALRWSLDDVTTPVGADAEPCECNEMGPDGLQDLTVKFATQDVVAAIGPVNDGDVVELEVTADLFDGTSVVFHDCVWIIDKTREGIRTALQAPDGGELKDNERSSTWGTIKALYR
jgi:hypothetical protein